MRLIDYRKRLIERLKKPDYAADYLAEVLTHESHSAFLIALRDVVEARGGNLSAFAKRVGMTRQALYKALSEDGNPRLSSLAAILNQLGIELHFRPKLQGSKVA